MRANRSRSLAVAIATAACLLMDTGASAQLPLEPPSKDFGQSVWPVYEGWYDNPDGSFTLLVGYFNPNAKETFDIPIGENNFLSPGPQDQAQPTHFAAGRTGRGWDVFTIRVPADFDDKRLTWSITSNNRTQAIPMHLDPQWYVEPFEDAANKNRPPTLRFEPGGKAYEGPPTGEVAASFQTTVGAAVEMPVWATDVKAQSLRLSPPSPTATPNRQQQRFRRPALVLRWYKLRGPGDVTFDEPVQEFETSAQNPTTKATFSAPGNYLLRVEALDEGGSGGGGFQCCWTSAHVKVSVADTPHTGN